MQTLTAPAHTNAAVVSGSAAVAVPTATTGPSPTSAAGIAASAKKKKKEYTPFPPQQMPSKLDISLESGEYFMSGEAKKERAAAAAAAQQQRRVDERAAQRGADFVAPRVSVVRCLCDILS